MSWENLSEDVAEMFARLEGVPERGEEFWSGLHLLPRSRAGRARTPRERAAAQARYRRERPLSERTASEREERARLKALVAGLAA